MKRFLKHIPVFLVCLILAVTPLLMCVPASASAEVSGDTVTWDGELTGSIGTVSFPIGAYLQTLTFVKVADNAPEFDVFENGYIEFVSRHNDGSSVSEFNTVCDPSDEEFVYIEESCLRLYDLIFCVYESGYTFVTDTYSVTFPSSGLYFCYSAFFDNDAFFSSTYPCSITATDFTFEPVLEPEDPPSEDPSTPIVPNGIYQSIFDLIHTYIYGGVEMSADMNLVCTLLATICCIYFFALPFLVVWFLIKLIGGR